MTRQVVPSIVLSVLIVCFFAVALYQPDPPGPGQGVRRSKTGGEIARTGSAPQASGRSSGARTRDVAPQAPDPAGRDTDRAASAPKDGTSGSPARSFTTVANRSGRPPRNSPGARTDARRREPIDTDFGPPPTDARKRVPIDTDFGPRRSFTVVRAGETLGDVARRVYGPAGEAGALWRANRDALQRRDSPLAVGMLLRTPELERMRDDANVSRRGD